MKYIVEIEMSRKHCMECPLMRGDDSCGYQDYDFDSWEEQMQACPLIEAQRNCMFDAVTTA